MIKGLVLSVLLVVCTGCGVRGVIITDPNDNVIGDVDIRLINVDGVSCVIAGTGRYDSGTAISCDWK